MCSCKIGGTKGLKMNDRFRFRIWDSDLQSYNDNPEYNVRIEIDQTFGMILVPFHNNIIEMCTGFSDKNGKLIYEGDIVKIPDDYETYGFMSGEKREVYFRDGGFRLKPKDAKLGRGHWLEQTSALEIIGNIHEQAEQKD